MGWRQEGAIASMSTMLLLSAVVREAYAYAMFAIVIIRHIPNIRERSWHQETNRPRNN